jgi:hypothetical protein
MEQEREEVRPQPTQSWRQWLQLLFPEARMRVATRRIPRDGFELLTRIPIIERIVIKRFSRTSCAINGSHNRTAIWTVATPYPPPRKPRGVPLWKTC